MKVASLLLVALCARCDAFVGSGVRTPHRSRAPADALVAHSSASPATEPPATPTADEIDAASLQFPLAGKSHSGRVDLQLQMGIIDSEYVSAVTAHICYWDHVDVIDYLIDLSRVQR